MKQKLLIIATLLFCSVGTWAQTDVTSTYLTNPGFEGTYTVYTYPRNDEGNARAIYQPEGWDIAYSNGESNDITSLNGDCLQWSNFSSKTQPTNGGSSTYWIRFRWGNSENLTLSQTVTLPAGAYVFSADAFFNGASGGSAKISANSNSTTITGNSTWSNYEVSFVLASETSVTFSLNLTQTQQVENIAAFDNFKLTYTAVVVKDVLETALTAATHANATLNSSDLTSAIATAQAVYDDENATQEEVNAAAATLNAAVELAMSAAGDASFLFPNLGFESCTAWTGNKASTGSAASEDYESEGWKLTASAGWGSSAVVEYNGQGQVNSASAPTTDNAGNSGKTLGFSVGWSALVAYQSAVATLPAGVYTITVNAYNANSKTQFASKFGFVPTTGTATLSTKTSFASGTWETDEVTFTLNEATEGCIQVGGQAVSGGSGDNAKVFFDNITIGYQSFLAGAKTAWEEAVAAANQAKTDCPNVTGEELTALNEELAKTEPTTVQGYDDAAAALTAATATFTAAKPAYDAYVEIRGIAVTFGVTPGDAPTSAAAAPAATHALNVAVYNATTADNIFDVTEVYAPSWSSMSTSSGQHWSGDTSISYADEWRGDTNPTERTATITLPAGEYILMSAGRGSDNTLATMSANNATVTFASNGDMGLGINKAGAASFDATDTEGFANKSGAEENTGTGWEWRYIPVTLSEETEITVSQKLTRLSGSAWGSFSDFKILKKGVVADADDYAALNAAISAAEAKTLGFEDDEYAPYNNVDALQALAAAKAFDQNVTNEKETVEAVTASLTSATWTANTSDVDAIYNGTFAETGTGSNPKGWTRSNNGWGQQITGLTAEANGVAEGTTTAWYYNTNGSWQYGNDGVYTMPLAANQTYELSFKYRKNGNDWQSWMKASVVNGDNEGLEVAQFSGADNGTNFVEAKAYFTTGAAGNYFLSIEQNGNAHLTDVSLVKAESAELALDEATAFESKDRTYYETVAMTRTVKDGFNTVCLPFDLTAKQVANTFGENAKVYTYEDVPNGTNSQINFNTKTGNTIEANVPVLIGDATASTEQSIGGVVFKSGEAKVEGTNFDFVGTYTASTTIAAGDYFIGNGALYKSAGATTIKAFRAYIKAKEASSGEVKMFIDGLETAIDGLTPDPSLSTRGEIYNIAGQRVSKAQKGIYIVNGKKALIK